MSFCQWARMGEIEAGGMQAKGRPRSGCSGILQALWVQTLPMNLMEGIRLPLPGDCVKHIDESFKAG